MFKTIFYVIGQLLPLRRNRDGVPNGFRRQRKPLPPVTPEMLNQCHEKIQQKRLLKQQEKATYNRETSK